MNDLDNREVAACGVDEFEALKRRSIVIENLESSYARRPSCWKDVSYDTWMSYDWQWKNRIFEAQSLERITPLSEDEKKAIESVRRSFSLAVSPHYAALIHAELASQCPIRMQCVPSPRELEVHEDLLDDPLGERRHAIAACATRRYPDRALLYTTHACAMRCRHCTRRSRVGLMENIAREAIEASILEIEKNENIRDVLISGGDPLSLDNETLRGIFEKLRRCAHIDVIRLCTRMPCTLPQRLDDPELLEMLEAFGPIYVNTQFNHPFEATIESARALRLLRKSGCILGNQSVLLRNINDRAELLEPLFRWLLKEGCRPYYLFLCDVAQGTYHFRTRIQTGLDIMRTLRGRLSGLAIPHFVIDLPDGHGKLDLCPQNIVSTRENLITFRTWYGAHVNYRDVETDENGV